jgi:hypothetical protein
LPEMSARFLKGRILVSVVFHPGKKRVEFVKYYNFILKSAPKSSICNDIHPP